MKLNSYPYKKILVVPSSYAIRLLLSSSQQDTYFEAPYCKTPRHWNYPLLKYFAMIEKLRPNCFYNLPR